MNRRSASSLSTPSRSPAQDTANWPGVSSQPPPSGPGKVLTTPPGASPILITAPSRTPNRSRATTGRSGANRATVVIRTTPSASVPRIDNCRPLASMLNPVIVSKWSKVKSSCAAAWMRCSAVSASISSLRLTWATPSASTHVPSDCTSAGRASSTAGRSQLPGPLISARTSASGDWGFTSDCRRKTCAETRRSPPASR